VSPEVKGFVAGMVMLAELPDGTDSALAADFGAEGIVEDWDRGSN